TRCAPAARSGEVEIVVDHVGGVVGEPRLAVDRTVAQAGRQARRDELVVDAPAHVLVASGAPLAPPGVLLLLGPQDAEAVVPAPLRRRRAVAMDIGDQAVEPGALRRQAARGLLVAGPV